MQAHLKNEQLYKNAQLYLTLYDIRKAVTGYNTHKTDLNEILYDENIFSPTGESTSACEMSTQTGNFTHNSKGDDFRQVCLPPFSGPYVG
jgi:hypothetical protein